MRSRYRPKTDRNWLSPQYKEWRDAVYRRDGWKCRWCGSRYRINAHHIKRWANHPSLRFVVGNGITLCKRCHDKVDGLEEEYEGMFLTILNKDASISVLLIAMRYADKTGNAEVHSDS